MVLHKIKSPTTSSSSMKSSSPSSSAIPSTVSSFSSPASVLKLNDLQGSSVHSIASFNVRGSACCATSAVRLDIDINDDDIIDAVTQQEEHQTQLFHQYSSSSSSDRSESTTTTTTTQRAQKAVPFPLPPFLDDVKEEHDSSSSSSNIDHQCDDMIAKHTATYSVGTYDSAARRTVSFSSNLVETHEILHRHDMEEEEKNDRWYRKKEWKKLRREGRVTARLMENEEIPAGSVDFEELGFCTLGLKQEPHPYAREKQLHKMLYKDLLMSEQQRQVDLGINDPETLAGTLIRLQNQCRHTSFVSSLRKQNTSPTPSASSFRPTL